MRFDLEEEMPEPETAAMTALRQSMEKEAAMLVRYFFKEVDISLAHTPKTYVFMQDLLWSIRHWTPEAKRLYYDLNQYDIVIVRGALFKRTEYIQFLEGNADLKPDRGPYRGVILGVNWPAEGTLKLAAYTAQQYLSIAAQGI